MERVLFQGRYGREPVWGDESSLWEALRCPRGRGDRIMDEAIIDAKDLAEFLQMDTDIIETEEQILVCFYVQSGFVFYDPARRQLERMIATCDSVRFRKWESYGYDCIMELSFLK